MGNPLPTSGLDLSCAVLNFKGIPVVRNNPHPRYIGQCDLNELLDWTLGSEHITLIKFNINIPFLKPLSFHFM